MALAPLSPRLAWSALIVGVLGFGAALGMGVALVSDSGGDDGAGFQATEAGFVVEPADKVGPDAFTAPTDTGPGATCNKGALLAELQARPDAYREWARVLGVPEADVPQYIDSLQPYVLTQDTAVTNHGLHNGQAYARPSLLVAGTAVLLDTRFPFSGTAPPVVATTTTPTTLGIPTTLGLPTTTLAATAVPVTRCRCGNPLLPPFATPPSLPTTTIATHAPPPPTKQSTSTSTVPPSSSTLPSSSTTESTTESTEPIL